MGLLDYMIMESQLASYGSSAGAGEVGGGQIHEVRFKISEETHLGVGFGWQIGASNLGAPRIHEKGFLVEATRTAIGASVFGRFSVFRDLTRNTSIGLIGDLGAHWMGRTVDVTRLDGGDVVAKDAPTGSVRTLVQALVGVRTLLDDAGWVGLSLEAGLRDVVGLESGGGLDHDLGWMIQVGFLVRYLDPGRT